MAPLVLILGSAGFIAGLIKVIREAILIGKNEQKAHIEPVGQRVTG
jgi:hypothetical protein